MAIELTTASANTLSGIRDALGALGKSNNDGVGPYDAIVRVSYANEIQNQALGISNPHGNVFLNGKWYLSSQTFSGATSNIVILNNILNNITDKTIVPVSFGNWIPVLTYNPGDGLIYGITANNNRLFTLNPANNTVTNLGVLPVNPDLNSAYITYGDYIYIGLTNSLAKVKISDLTLVEQVNVVGIPHGMAITEDNNYILATTLSRRFYKIQISDFSFSELNLEGFGILIPTDDLATKENYAFIACEIGDDNGINKSDDRSFLVIDWTDMSAVVFDNVAASWFCGVSEDGNYVYFGSRNNKISRYNISNNTVRNFSVTNDSYNEFLNYGGKFFVTTYGSSARIIELEFKEDYTVKGLNADEYVTYNARKNINLRDYNIIGNETSSITIGNTVTNTDGITATSAKFFDKISSDIIESTQFNILTGNGEGRVNFTGGNVNINKILILDCPTEEYNGEYSFIEQVSDYKLYEKETLSIFVYNEGYFDPNGFRVVLSGASLNYNAYGLPFEEAYDIPDYNSYPFVGKYSTSQYIFKITKNETEDILEHDGTNLIIKSNVHLLSATVTTGQTLTASLSSLILTINEQQYKIPLLPV